MAIFRKNEDQHAGSGPDPKTLTEKITDTVKAALPARESKVKNEIPDPAALDIPPAD